MYCTAFALVRQHEFHTLVRPLYCNCWSCETCAPRRTKRLAREAAEGNPNRFITLTVRARDDDRQDLRARELVLAWRAVCKLIRRRDGKRKLDFLAVFERTRRGEPHLHILVRSGYIDQRWLSAQMQRLIGAPIVHVQAVKGSRQAARYVAKYCAKGLGVFRGCKRYWRSLRYLEPADDPPIMDAWGLPTRWRVEREDWREYAQRIAPASWAILWRRNEAEVHFPGPCSVAPVNFPRPP